MTAFGTTALQNQTAVLGGHTGAETVGTLALQIARLKSSLRHGGIPECVKNAQFYAHCRNKSMPQNGARAQSEVLEKRNIDSASAAPLVKFYARIIGLTFLWIHS